MILHVSLCLWERVMTLLYHLGYIRWELLLQQACQNLCTKHDTCSMTAGTPLLWGVPSVCRTEWPPLSSVTHTPDIAAWPDLETTAQMHFGHNLMEQGRDCNLNSVKRVRPSKSCAEGSLPQCWLWSFPYPIDQNIISSSTWFACCWVSHHTKEGATSSCTEKTVVRTAQTTYTGFLSNITKATRNLHFLCQATLVYIGTFARVSTVKNNLMPLKNTNLSLKALCMNLP